MKPGHGEVLLAEGDVEVDEEHEPLVAAFRAQIDAGHVGRRAADGRRRPSRGAARPVLRRGAARRRSRHLLPARRGRTVGGMVLALSVTAIVIVVLLWEVAIPHIERWNERRKARRAIVSGHRDGPGRERRAEQRARALLRSCVNDEEWAMYRDLGFLRVWGRLANGPGQPGRAAEGAPVRVPRVPAQADRGLPAADPRAALRALRRSSPTRRGPTARRCCRTPTTCSRSGWRSPATSSG